MYLGKGKWHIGGDGERETTPRNSLCLVSILQIKDHISNCDTLGPVLDVMIFYRN